jgi:NTE family protein
MESTKDNSTEFIESISSEVIKKSNTEIEQSVGQETEKDTNEVIIEETNTDKEQRATPSNINTIVLSGGSVKGLGTLGALQCCFDNNLLDNVDTYIGTSSGFMIAYLLGIGYTPSELIAFICTNNVFGELQYIDVVSLANGEGGIDFSKISQQLERLTVDRLGFFVTLGKLREIKGITLIGSTYNYTEGHVEYLTPDTHPDLPCITAVRMSAGLPFIFEPFKYMTSHYIDGGLADNFGIQLGDVEGRNVMGILIMPEKNEGGQEELRTLEFMYNLIFIPVHQIMEYKIAQASDRCKIIRLRMGKFKFFNFNISSKQILNLFSRGYEIAKDYLENHWY